MQVFKIVLIKHGKTSLTHILSILRCYVLHVIGCSIPAVCPGPATHFVLPRPFWRCHQDSNPCGAGIGAVVIPHEALVHPGMLGTYGRQGEGGVCDARNALNMFYSGIEYTEKDWVRRAA